MSYKNLQLLIGKTGILLLLAAVFFRDMITAYFINSALLILTGVLMSLFIAEFPKRFSVRIKKGSNIAYFISFVVLFIMFVFHNSVFKLGNEGVAISFACFTFLIFSFSYSEKWADFLCRWLTVIAVVFPIITIVFFVLPDVCTSVMRPIWLDICGNIFAPGGRNAPYKVGFTNHYSTNGIYCSIACICCYLKVLFNNKRIWKVLLIVSFVGLLLTSKRAHLLFTVFAFLVTYYFIKPQKRTGRLIKASFILFGVLALIIIMSGFIPELASTFKRFDVGDNGDISNNRFALWGIAMEGFKSSPVFGIGWYGYALLYNKYMILGIKDQAAHNVYIQMLCENGIVGLICYLIIVIFIFTKTVTLLKSVSAADSSYHYFLSLSLCIQSFFLSYSLTGNCLYDRMYYFYAFACALTFYVARKLKEKELIAKNESRNINVS